MEHMMDILKRLSPFEQWMVKSNLKTIKETGVSAEEQAAIVRANGYPQIAEAILEVAKKEKKSSSSD